MGIEVVLRREGAVQRPDPALARLARRTVRACFADSGRGLDLTNVEVTVALVGDDEIARLNKTYRDVDGPTDVLSFPMDELHELREPGEPPPPPEQTTASEPVPGPPLVLGDVVVSLDTAGRQADRLGHTLADEVGCLVVHGVLHLLGFDDESGEARARMAETEDRIARKLSLPRVLLRRADSQAEGRSRRSGGRGAEAGQDSAGRRSR